MYLKKIVKMSFTSLTESHTKNSDGVFSTAGCQAFKMFFGHGRMGNHSTDTSIRSDRTKPHVGPNWEQNLNKLKNCILALHRIVRFYFDKHYA